jgi:hypothetical protein
MIVSRLRKIERAHSGLLTELDTTCALASDPAKAARCAEAVSAWTVQQHLEHLLLADKAIAGGLLESAEGRGQPARSGRPTLTGYLVLWRRSIPRGRGRAPEISIPQGLQLNEVAAGLNEAKGKFEGLKSALPQLAAARFTRPHPILGHFTPLQWMEFTHIHHVHHGKIIDDILASRTVAPAGTLIHHE